MVRGANGGTDMVYVVLKWCMHVGCHWSMAYAYVAISGNGTEMMRCATSGGSVKDRPALQLIL
eukprot:1205347-Rhodomonas_salina.1